ncbi:MAG: hypothetical protein ACOX2K_08940 [Bacillota bacterium]|jgi:putative redox protein
MSLGAAGYCRNNGLDATGTRIELEIETDRETKLISKMAFKVFFPEGIPEEHRTAIRQRMANCYIKRHLFTPPEVTVEVAE